MGIGLTLAVLASCGEAPGPAAATPGEPSTAPAPADAAVAADSAATDQDGAHDVTGDPLPMSFDRVWQSWTGDLDDMLSRRIIRVAAPYGGYQFYYENGRPRGATWELLQKFEKHVNATLAAGEVPVHVVVIPLGRDQLIPNLLDGHADLVAADLTITDERAARVTFSRPVLENVSEVLVVGPAGPDLASLDDLAGQQLIVRASSSYYEHLGSLAADFEARGLAPPEIIPADELLEAEDLLEMVNNGLVPLTVMDDYKAEFWQSVFPHIAVRRDLVINTGGQIAWATRPDNPGFAGLVDGFLKKYGKGTLVGNDTYNRYLADASAIRCSTAPKAMEDVEALIGTFQEYGEIYGFEWLMLAAQAFQESGFEQDRRSRAGAVGIMQIKPSTAADPNVGIADVSTVDGNVHAGTRYMRFLADRYFPAPEFDALSQWLFTLAAYNAGPARVAGLRREADRSGYDSNRWFDNVEIVAARRIGPETITYVSNIFKYYVGYELAFRRSVQRTARFSDDLAGCRSVTG